MTMPDPIEARLAAIEARCAAVPDFMATEERDPSTYMWDREFVDDEGYTLAAFSSVEMFHYAATAHHDIAWLVGLVRRYRRALEGVAALASSSDIEQQAIWDTAREALNEEVPP